LFSLGAGEALARGVTPYLPLNLDPQVERQIERVLILADKPVMRRPIPAAVVLDALPKACQIDPVLCANVRKFLGHYMNVSDLGFASLGVAATNGSGGKTVMPNQHGETMDSPFDAALLVYWQPSDWALVNLGGVAYQGRTTPTGTMLSLGWDAAQLDIGWRDHWWSPMTDSAMLISTEAATMPSITLSNYRPLTRLGLQYETFVARMSYSDKIKLTDGTFTAGNPKYGGLHVSIEPVSGWSLGAQRTMVWGGGAAGGQSVHDILRAFFNPSKGQSTGFGTAHPVGKQMGSLSSRFIFPGRVPFAVYFEYGGNDTEKGYNYLLGKPALLGGVHFPHVGPLDVTFESQVWQPSWYTGFGSAVQPSYLDGITNYMRIIGNWFGDQREFGDAVGGRSSMLRVGWEPRFGGLLEAQFRTLVNDSYYSALAYHHLNIGSLSYAYPWKEYAIGAQFDAGQDVFGGKFTRLEAFLRYGQALRSANSESADSAFNGQRADGSEIFIAAGATANKVEAEIISTQPRVTTGPEYGAHVGIGARRQVSEHQDLGVAIEGDDIQGLSLLSVRAIDYRYRFTGPLAMNLFLGATRYALATPGLGLYLGGGLQWRNILPNWDLGLDYRAGVEVSRQRLLPSDPQGGYRPDAFYNISMLTLYLAWKF
jgi:hypothetical protein